MSKVNSVAYTNLREEMAKRKVTIGEMAEIVNVSRNTISRKLSMKNPLSFSEAVRIHDEFFADTDITELFKTVYRSSDLPTR